MADEVKAIAAVLATPQGIFVLMLLAALYLVRGWYSTKREKEIAASTARLQVQADAAREEKEAERESRYLSLLQGAMADNKAVVDQLRAENNAMQQKVNDLRADLDAEKANGALSETDLKAKIAAIQNEAERNAEAMQTRLNQVEAELVQARQQLANERIERERQVTDLTRQVSAAQGEARRERERADQLALQLRELQAKVESFNTRPTTETIGVSANGASGEVKT